MKISINTDDRCTETEIAVTCNHLSDDIEKLLAAIRMWDMKLTGRKDGRQYILEAADIVYIDSIEKHTFLYSSTGVYETPFKLYELETKLACRDFVRASKNSLLNINHIQFIEPAVDRRLILKMTGDIELVVSRQYSAAVKEKLEVYSLTN